MKQDNIQYEILADGTISITTDQVSATNHVSADKLLAELFDVVGGTVTAEKRSRLAGGMHVHMHDHIHQH
jgi:hypothetical protein